MQQAKTFEGNLKELSASMSPSGKPILSAIGTYTKTSDEGSTVAIMAAIIYSGRAEDDEPAMGLSRLSWASSEAKLLYDDVQVQLRELAEDEEKVNA